jgi:Flp pilus assembly protein TadG
MRRPVFQKKEKGQSLVEMAISVTLLILLLAGIVDLGRAAYTLMALQDAAEEGVVFGVAFPNQCSNIENRVRYGLASGMHPESTTVNVEINGVTCSAASPHAAQEMLITVSQPFQITMPILGAVIGQTIPLSATANGVILRPQS